MPDLSYLLGEGQYSNKAEQSAILNHPHEPPTVGNELLNIATSFEGFCLFCGFVVIVLYAKYSKKKSYTDDLLSQASQDIPPITADSVPITPAGKKMNSTQKILLSAFTPILTGIATVTSIVSKSQYQDPFNLGETAGYWLMAIIVITCTELYIWRDKGEESQ